MEKSRSVCAVDVLFTPTNEELHAWRRSEEYYDPPSLSEEADVNVLRAAASLADHLEGGNKHAPELPLPRIAITNVNLSFQCEWTYVLDLSESVFEVHTTHLARRMTVLPSQRFNAFVEQYDKDVAKITKNPTQAVRKGKAPRMVGRCKLDELPSQKEVLKSLPEY
jgi:hypothetical protein